MTLRVLIAEDEPDVATMVAYGVRLTWPDSRVAGAVAGDEALRRFADEGADLVILDVTMPPPDGFAVLQQIRAVSPVPILMLSVRADTPNKVRALDLGADDYLTKPFDPLELLARLRALVRRARGALAPGPGAAPIVAGDVTLDPAVHEVRVRGEVVALTSTEYRLLEELVRHAGRAPPHPPAGARVGAGVRRRGALPARVRAPLAPQARRRRRAPSLHPDRVAQRLPLRPHPVTTP